MDAHGIHGENRDTMKAAAMKAANATTDEELIEHVHEDGPTVWPLYAVPLIMIIRLCLGH